MDFNSFGSGCVKLEFTVLNLRTELIRGRRVDVRAPEQQAHLNRLTLDILEGLPDVDAELAELRHAWVVNELDVLLKRAVEDDAHDGLLGANRAVGLGVDFVGANGVALADEGVENVLAELLTFDDNLLLVWMLTRIKGRQCVDPVGHLRDSRGNRAWVKPVHAGAPDYRDLRAARDQNLELLSLKLVNDLRLQVFALREASHHEDEVDQLLLGFRLLD